MRCLLLILILLAAYAQAYRGESNNNPPSVKQCRQQIELALEHCRDQTSDDQNFESNYQNEITEEGTDIHHETDENDQAVEPETNIPHDAQNTEYTSNYEQDTTNHEAPDTSLEMEQNVAEEEPVVENYVHFEDSNEDVFKEVNPKDDIAVPDEEQSVEEFNVEEPAMVEDNKAEDEDHKHDEQPIHEETSREEIPAVNPETMTKPESLGSEIKDNKVEEVKNVKTHVENNPYRSSSEQLIIAEPEKVDDSDLALEDEAFLESDQGSLVDLILGHMSIPEDIGEEGKKVLREIRKIHAAAIRPMEQLYKFPDSSSHTLTDAEILNKPMILFLGPWNSGKSLLINTLLGIEGTSAALKAGSDVDFTLLQYGEKKHIVSGTELVADWKYSGTQKFGQSFLDHFRALHLPHNLLKRVTIVDTPGILEGPKNSQRGFQFNDVIQWFADRADAVYVVLEPAKIDVGAELGGAISRLREPRFVLSRSDTVPDLVSVLGRLFWHLSPLLSAPSPPRIFALRSSTFNLDRNAIFLADQERSLLRDMRKALSDAVPNRLLYARRHAIKVRNHATTVDCYLASYYRHKSLFSSRRSVAGKITDNPQDFGIFEGARNASRLDRPDPLAYKEFFKRNPLYDFKPLASTCSYFRGCPMDRLDQAIAKDIPALLAVYNRARALEQMRNESG